MLNEAPTNNGACTVSDSEWNLEYSAAMDLIRWPFLRLAANSIRVVRGAGEPSYVLKYCREAILAFSEYYETMGHGVPGWDANHVLSLDSSENKSLLGGAMESEWAERSIIRGALQIAASRLLAQRPQEAAGRSEMFSGINEIIRMRERR